MSLHPRPLAESLRQVDGSEPDCGFGIKNRDLESAGRNDVVVVGDGDGSDDVLDGGDDT